tara:strand:- start:298 stop:2208 length:1911 start_codon:yes stop_codon:yes gene_type:complete
MPLTKLQFKPGVNRETTSYTNEGGWFDVDKVRFRFGMPEKIGGWEKFSGFSYLGTARAMHPWVALDNGRFIGIGTSLKYYLNQDGGSFSDITPIRSTTSAGDVTFAASNGSSTITVTDIAHGAVSGDFVTFSGAASLGGNITAAVLNQEYNITEILTDNTYTISARAAGTSIQDITVNGALSPSLVNASGSDSGNGGSSTVGAYQISIGLDTSTFGAGWGIGFWGRGTWNSAATTPLVTSTLRVWSHDNFGEDLLINVRNGGIYYWDKTTGSAARAVSLDSLAGATSTPTIAKQVMVSDRDRHIIAFGCDTEANPGVQDPLAIRFSSQESLTDWASTATNTAGELRLGSGSEIVTAVETRQQILVYTDESLYAMQFLGPPFTFGVNLVSENITTMGPLCAVAVEDNVFWMGQKEFYVYGGTVQRLPCTVRDFVFDDINLNQREKIVASTNTSFSEVWWFYPSASSDTNDRYVVYNYEQQVWYFGAMARSFWMDRGIFDQPIAAGPNNYLYSQETGFDDDGSALTAYIESSQIDIADGEQFSFIRRMIPDLTFRGSTAGSPSANITVKTRNFPGGNYLQSTSSAITKSASVPVEQFTDQVHLRLRGRSFAMRVESTASGVGWRLGSPRLDVRPDGRR